MLKGKEFLQSKNIWFNPSIYDFVNKIKYNVDKLLDDYAVYIINYYENKKNDKNKSKSVSEYFDNDVFIQNVCLSYRHDFGLMSKKQQNELIFECKEWMRAIKNNENVKKYE